MPRYRPETDKLKAETLAKSCIENRLNQSAVARKEGVTHQAINQRVNRPIVQQTLQEALRKAGINQQYKTKKFKELLEAKELRVKKGKLKRVSDNFCRLGALKLLCQVDGDIKDSKNGNGTHITSIVVNIKSPNKFLSQSEQEIIHANR